MAVGQRLRVGHVQAGAGDLAFLQGGHQVRRLHQAAAATLMK